MTTTPPQPPQQQYSDRPAPGGYGPPQDQFPRYTQQPGPHQPTPAAEQGQPGPATYGQAGPQQPGRVETGQRGPAPYGQPGPQQAGPVEYGQPAPGPQYGPGAGQFPGGPQYGAGAGWGYADAPQRTGVPQYNGSGAVGAPQHVGAAQYGQLGRAGGVQCRFCGGVPAVQATVRGHQGLVVLMRFLKLQGPFCKTCGTAAVRDMTAKSMWQGWWGIGSVIVNPITMLMNLDAAQKFKNLPQPAPGAPGRPMDPGKPLFRRPQAIGLLIPVALIALIVVANLTSAGGASTPSSASVGDCVHNAGTVGDPDVRVVDCSDADAQYKVLGKVYSADETQCERYDGYTVAYTEERRSSAWTLCLGPNR